VRLVDLGDPFLPRLLDFLARAGVDVAADAPTALLTAGVGKVPEAPLPARSMLAIGSAGIAVLVRDGAVVERLAQPDYARRVEGRVDRSGFLDGLDPLRVGLYAACSIRGRDLPAVWRPIARYGEDHTLAAVDDASRRCVLLFRPDSVLSLGGSTGSRALHMALDWLAL
jgi:hypothetical protein